MELLTSTLSRINGADDPELARQIQHRLDHLTKPRGSLGRLEEVVLRYGLARGEADCRVTHKAMFVFCGDHGVTDEGVSAYPREVTGQMVRNFAAGGAAINVLCRQYEIDPVIVDMGVADDLEGVGGIVSRKVAAGTRNFLREPAMTRDQAVRSIETGISLAEAAAGLGYDLLGAGDMGIGNTTASSAVLAAISGVEPGKVVGPGAGLDDDELRHKVAVVERALDLHKPEPSDPVAVLAAVGGFEIGGITGFLLGSAAARIPVVVDGLIASTGALLAMNLCKKCQDYLFFAHQSAEPGHQVFFEVLKASPLLKLDMRLGEGSGAALAMGLIESAVRLYSEMATFESARVSDSEKAERAADSS